MHQLSTNSADVDSDDEFDYGSDDEDFEAIFVKKFKKLLDKKKSGLKCSHKKNKAQNRNNYMPKSDKPFGKSSSKGIQCFESQGYHHTTATCGNRKEKRLGKALNAKWNDDSENKNYEPKRPFGIVPMLFLIPC